MSFTAFLHFLHICVLLRYFDTSTTFLSRFAHSQLISEGFVLEVGKIFERMIIFDARSMFTFRISAGEMKAEQGCCGQANDSSDKHCCEASAVIGRFLLAIANQGDHVRHSVPYEQPAGGSHFLRI